MASKEGLSGIKNGGNLHAMVARTTSRSHEIVSRSEQLTRKSNRILSRTFRVLQTTAMALAQAHPLSKDGLREVPSPILRLIARRHNYNPDPVQYLRVEGESMMPLIHDGYIVALDTSIADASQLAGSIVVASHPDNGLVVSRLQCLHDQNWLVPENPEYRAVEMPSDSLWAITGKVIWWLGHSA